MSKEIHLLVVGKQNDPMLEQWEREYCKRINSPSLIIHEVKACSGNKADEAKHLQQKMNELRKSGPIYPIALDAEGAIFDSHQLSTRLYDLLAKQRAKILFIIGGALGLDEKLLEEAEMTVSLSPLTFPHKLARIIIVEQLYRAQTIHLGHPYHH